MCSTFTRECKKGRGLNIFQANSVILWQAPRDSMKSAVKPGLPVRIISRQEGMGQGLKSGILPKVSIPGRMRSSSDFCDRPVLHGIPDLYAVTLSKVGRTLCRHGSRVHIGQHKGANPDFIGKP